MTKPEFAVFTPASMPPDAGALKQMVGLVLRCMPGYALASSLTDL